MAFTAHAIFNMFQQELEFISLTGAVVQLGLIQIQAFDNVNVTYTIIFSGWYRSECIFI